MRSVVVLPTYNEVDNIERTVEALLTLPLDLDVIVVDDSSPDGTGKAVLALAEGALPGRVTLLTRPLRQGLAAAYRDGFTRAIECHYDVIIQMDADGSHPVAAVNDLLTAIGVGQSGPDLVIASRYIDGGGTAADWPWHRKLLSSGGNLYARRLLDVPYRDLTGGFKAWRGSLLALLQPVGAGLSGYAFQIDTTLRAHRLGARIVEVPFVFRERELGISKMSPAIALEAVGAVWKMRKVMA